MGLGAGEQEAKAQAIPQPVAVGLQQALRGRGPLQAPALRQAVAIKGGLFGGLQRAAAAGQLGGLLIAQGWGVEQGLIFGSLGLLSDGGQIGRDGGGGGGAVLRAWGLQLPPLPLQQAGDRGAVGEALPVALRPQFAPGLQPGPLSVSFFQRPQQRISDGPKVADQVGRIGGAGSHPQGPSGARLGGEQIGGHLRAADTGEGLGGVLGGDATTSQGDHGGGPPAGEAHPGADRGRDVEGIQPRREAVRIGSQAGRGLWCGAVDHLHPGTGYPLPVQGGEGLGGVL